MENAEVTPTRDYESLRRKHPRFHLSVSSQPDGEQRSQVTCHHRVPDLLDCHSVISFEMPSAVDWSSTFPEEHLALVESISYWKAACPPLLEIEDLHLDHHQERFWKKLFYKGLGEFRYENGIEADPQTFVSLKTSSEQQPPVSHPPVQEERFIVPVSGGKDSAVTLSLLTELPGDPILLLLNPLPAAERVIQAAGAERLPQVRISREIHPDLLALNRNGYLNGHTPFSALLAFTSAYAAAACGAKSIILSNEGSAEEGNTSDNGVNHQYSKSFEFEKDFQNYISASLGSPLYYFSLLRPLNELQITALLVERSENSLSQFLSCNRGGRDDYWCKECPKCLFVALCLACFLPHERIVQIFRGDPFALSDEKLSLLADLALPDRVKPFECVGTRREVQCALGVLREKSASPLVTQFFSTFSSNIPAPLPLTELLSEWNPGHSLPKPMEETLREALSEVQK